MTLSCRGFSLITAVMLVLLMSTMGLFLQLRLASQWRMATNVDSQLYSLVLAENGIEYARTLVPHVKLNSLLEGPDGKYCESHGPGWRNPMSFQKAWQVVPSSWRPLCDDGLPSYLGQRLLPNGGYRAEADGYFFLKFSNNPEERPDYDEDQIVVVRSLGIVPSRLTDPSFPEVRNNVALLEARFRQERAFELRSPLTLFADSGVFHWDGTQFTINGGEAFAVSMVSVTTSTLYQDLIGSLSPVQQARIRGGGMALSIRDATAAYITEMAFQDLFRPSFWNHFITQLPDFSGTQTEGITFLPDGGVLRTSLRGILVAAGDLLLQDSSRVEGLILHLGNGSLVLKDTAEIVGGVWMSNLDTAGETLKSKPLSLWVSGSSSVRFSPAAVGAALGYLPPTQLGWRILFPETVQ